MGLRSYKAGPRAEADRSRGVTGRKPCRCAPARNVLSPINPITKSRPIEICEGSTSTCSDIPTMRIPPQQSNSVFPNSFAGVRRQRTAIQIFLANTMAKREVPIPPTSSSNSSTPLCACGTLQPRVLEISLAAGLICDQNALNPQPNSGLCEIQMSTKYHNSVRPVSVASFPRRSRMKSGDSQITSTVGIETIVIITAKCLPETARRISTAQKRSTVIREVEDLAATVRPINSMIIAMQERRLPPPDLISYRLASTPAAMT